MHVLCVHAEVNLSNFDEQRQQRSHHGDVVAGSGRCSQEGGGGCFQGGISLSHTHTQTYIQPLLCQRLGDTMSPTAIVGPAWVAPGLLCVSQCVCVCHTKGVPAWAAICHPPSQGEERGGGDPWPLKPPVGPFSQSHAGRAPCLKSHGCLSGIGMEGGGWEVVGRGGGYSPDCGNSFVKRIMCTHKYIHS